MAPALQNLRNNFQYHLAPYILIVYAIIATLISFTIELSPTFQAEKYWMAYSIFGVSMLFISIVFYIIVGVTSIRKLQFLMNDTPLVGIGASVFFLRLGAAAFGILGIILWSIELFLAFASDMRPVICIVRTCLYIIFHVAQLIFVLNSSRIVFRCHWLIVYFGLAHCLVVNLWTWVSLCVAKSGIGKDNNIHNLHFGNLTSASFVLYPTEPPTIDMITFERHEQKLRVVQYFGSTAVALLTGNVEFCLASAGVLLCLFLTCASDLPRDDEREASYVGFDYNNMSIGVAIGTVMLVLTCLDIAVSNILRCSNYPWEAGFVVGIFQVCFYAISIIACLITYSCLLKHVGRRPEYQVPSHGHHESYQATINVIFLLIGVSGEVILCAVGIMGIIEGSSVPDSSALSLTLFIVRLLEVGVQAILLLYLLKRCNTIEACGTTGKQAITFLIALNIILFGFHTLESTVNSFGFPTKLDKTHLIFLKIAIPLVVFYRFHSAVCFAEVWKHFYHTQPLAISVVTTPRASSTPDGNSSPNSARYLLPDRLQFSNGFEVPTHQSPSSLHHS